MSTEPTAEPGAITACNRCGVPLQVAQERQADAKMLRKAKTAEGVCLNCSVAEWFNTYDVRRLVPDPAALRLPHVQVQFGTLMRVGLSEAKLEDIDWEHVIANWDLPFKTRAGRRRTR